MSEPTEAEKKLAGVIWDYLWSPEANSIDGIAQRLAAHRAPDAAELANTNLLIALRRIAGENYQGVDFSVRVNRMREIAIDALARHEGQAEG